MEQKLQNKNSGIKIGGDPWGHQVQVQKGQWNKNCGPSWTPSARAKRSVELKTAEQKQWNKNCRTKTAD